MLKGNIKQETLADSARQEKSHGFSAGNYHIASRDRVVLTGIRCVHPSLTRVRIWVFDSAKKEKDMPDTT